MQQGNELEIEISRVSYSIRVILRHLFYEYHYSPHKLAFQNIMRAGDQKLMEWPYTARMNCGGKIMSQHLIANLGGFNFSL